MAGCRLRAFLTLLLLAPHISCGHRTVEWSDSLPGYFFKNDQSTLIKSLERTSPISCGAHCLDVNQCRSFCMFDGTCFLSSIDRWIEPGFLVPNDRSVYFGLAEHAFPTCMRANYSYSMLEDDEECGIWTKRFDCTPIGEWGEWGAWTAHNSTHRVRSSTRPSLGPFHGGRGCEGDTSVVWEQLGWYDSRQVTQSTAINRCRSPHGALLASPHTKTEARQLNPRQQSWWTGWRKEGGTWKDRQGRTVSNWNALWMDGEPNDSGSGGQLFYYRGRVGLDDAPETGLLPFVCYLPRWHR